jgi:hypothetical protein
MRAETRRRLDQMLWRQRLKYAGIGAAVVLVLAAMFWFTDLDTKVVDRNVAGTIEQVGPVNSKNASQGLAVDVKLDDGRHVQVIALRSREPHVGERVEVVEHRHGTGRVTFTYK